MSAIAEDASPLSEDIFDEYQDLSDPEFVEMYELSTSPTALDNEGMIYEFDVAVGLIQQNGHIGEVAKALRRSRRSISSYLERRPMLRHLQEDLKLAVIDTAEEKARALVEAGDGSMVKFILSTLGKKRGYVSRQENTGPDGEALNVLFYLPENNRDNTDDQEE